jgi:hypothetical protein
MTPATQTLTTFKMPKVLTGAQARPAAAFSPILSSSKLVPPIRVDNPEIWTNPMLNADSGSPFAGWRFGWELAVGGLMEVSVVSDIME